MVMTEGTGGGGSTSTGGTGYLVNTCTNGSFERDTISQAQTYSDGSLGSSWTLGGGYGNRYMLSTAWKGPSSVGVQSIQARTIYADYGNPASLKQNISVTSGHLYFYSAWGNKIANASVAEFVISDGNNTQISTFSNGESRVYATFRPTSSTVTIKLRIKQSGIDGNSDYCYFDNIMFIDVTSTYGAGYEPTATSLATLVTNGGGYWDGSKNLSSISSGTVLSPPTNLSGTPDSGSVILRWTHSYSTLPQYYNWWTQDSSGNWFKQGTPQIPGTNTNYTLTGLNNGQTYIIALSAHNTYGDSARSNSISITPGSTALSAPSGLTIQNNGTSNPTVVWNAVSGATGYHISQVQGSPYIISVNSNSWTVNGIMIAGTYNIYVNAYNNSGQSTYSGPVTMVIGAGQGSSGGTTPTAFNLTAVATYGQVSLTWSVSEGASMYQVYRSQDNTANPVMRVNNVRGTSYVDNAENGHTYYYYVSAQSDTSIVNSNTVAATPSASAGSALPDQITGFRASPGTTTVTLSWNWISTDREIIQGYRIYDPNVGLIWSNNEGNLPVSLDPYESFTLTTTIKNLLPSTSYTFSVVAYFPDNAGGAEGPATSVTFTTQDTSAPGPPTNIQVNDGLTASTISWVRPNAGEAGYRLYNADNTILMGSISSNISQVQISGLKGGDTYSCYMCCYITSPTFKLGTKSANFVLAPMVNNPSMPNNFSVYIDNGVPVLNWSSPTNSGTPAYVGYHIYRQEQDILTGTIMATYQDVSPYATTSQTATQFRDNAITKKRIYSYYVTAYANNSGDLIDGDKTAINTARIIDKPQTVENLESRLVNGIYPVLTWTPPVDDGGEFPILYRIYCDTTNGTTLVSEVDNMVNEAIQIDTSTNTTYYYNVSAVNNAGESTKSSTSIAIPSDAVNNIIYSVTNLIQNGSFDLDMGTAAWSVSPPINATIIDALPGMVYENALQLTGPCEAYQDVGVQVGHTILAIWVGSVVSGNPEVDIYSVGDTNNSYTMSSTSVTKYFKSFDVKDTDKGSIKFKMKCPEGSSCIFDGIMLIDLTNIFAHGATFTTESNKYAEFMEIINNFVSGYWEGTFTIPSG